MWKENLLVNLELGEVEFGSAGEFLLELKKEFGREDEESVKVVELKKIGEERPWKNSFKDLKGQQEEVVMKEEY